MTASGFESGLFAPGLAGVHAVPDDELPMVAMAAVDAGLRPTWIDLAHCSGKSMLLLRMAVALDAPSGSGRNWDALSDLLRDLGWLDAPGGHALLLAFAGDLREAAPADFDTLLSILHEAVESWAGTDTPLWVFLGLAGSGVESSGDDDA